jgi:hypothetical protein
MNFFNGFGFGKHNDKGCGCDDGNDFMSFFMLYWLISCCGINIDICEILPIILLLSLLGNCGCGQNHCGKPY